MVSFISGGQPYSIVGTKLVSELQWNTKTQIQCIPPYQGKTKMDYPLVVVTTTIGVIIGIFISLVLIWIEDLTLDRQIRKLEKIQKEKK
jgi:capsular polysaccharide biosynthesis protein